MNKTKILYRLEVVSPLHIGSGDSGEISPVDSPFFKMPEYRGNSDTPEFKAVIPASTLNGKIRSIIEDIIRMEAEQNGDDPQKWDKWGKSDICKCNSIIDRISLEKEKDQKKAIKDAKDYIKKYFDAPYFRDAEEDEKYFYRNVCYPGFVLDEPGTVEYNENEDNGKFWWLKAIEGKYNNEEEPVKRNCIATRMFGGKHNKRRITFTNAYKENGKEFSMNVFWNNSINRLTGVCKEGALFNKEKEARGIKYYFVATVDDFIIEKGKKSDESTVESEKPPKKAIDYLKDAIDYLNNGLYGIGAGFGKGDGRVRIDGENGNLQGANIEDYPEPLHPDIEYIMKTLKKPGESQS